ncbi:MAG: hypothetical protein AB8B82_01020 [Roseovarius sp.]
MDTLAGQGCVIGPETAEILTATGLDTTVLDALKAQGTPAGEWAVLPPEICTIRLPVVGSEIGLTTVQPFISPADAYADLEEPGCFLDAQSLRQELMANGASEDAAFQAYLSFVAKGLVQGDWVFYSDSPLKTPVGFQYLGGACGEVPGVAARRANHAVLVETFDAYIRQSAQLIPCEEGEFLMHPAWSDIIQPLSAGRNTNAWIAFEMTIITMAAGWYKGASATAKGTPRPPICHIP